MFHLPVVQIVSPTLAFKGGYCNMSLSLGTFWHASGPFGTSFGEKENTV